MTKMSVLMRNGSWYEVVSSGSSDSGGSGGTSTTNSTCSIPNMAMSSTHSSIASPSHTLSPTDEAVAHSPTNTDEEHERKLKNFTLDLNGDMTDLEVPLPDVFSPSDVSSLDWERPEVRSMQYGNCYSNKESLAKDLGALSSMPEFCDVTFLVGEGRQPVCGVRAILAARSRVFKKLLYMDSSATIGVKKCKKKKHPIPSDSYVEKHDGRGEPTVVKDFEPEVFKLLIDYTHTGGVILQSRTLLGLMNAADHFCLEDLKQACICSMERCITIETVCVLLTTAEKYIQYKSTKSLIQKILEFVDVNAAAILSLEDFANLPQHIVRIVLGREELKVSEMEKFEAAHRWALRYCRTYPESEIKDAFEPFMGVIKYSNIPARLLMQKVKKAGVVDDIHLLAALAFQADPSSVLPSSILPARPLSAILPAASNSSSTLLSRLQKMSTSPSINTKRVAPTGPFRRVYSSGNKVDFGVNCKTSSSASFLSSILTDSRIARAGSAPLNVSDGDVRSPRERIGEFYLRESEVHPLCLHDDMRDHVISSSSSHLSILSTPPLSPALSSHQASLASVSSGDSGHSRTSLSGGVVPAVTSSSDIDVTSSGSVLGKPEVSNMNILSYNPQALDAIVNLST